MPNGSMDFVIRKGMTFPCHAVEVYSNSQDNQTIFEIEIYEGNSEQATDNEFLKKHTVEMRPCPRGQALIEVTFELNAKGDLNVSHKVKNDDPVELKVPENLGIEMGDGKMSIVIPKGTEFPCFVEKKYTNQTDEQDSFDITIFQGPSMIARQNKLLQEYKVKMEPCP